MRAPVVILAAIGILASLALVVIDPYDPSTDTLVKLVGDIAFVGSLLAFVLSGSAILFRRPDIGIGWLLLLPGVVMPSSEVAVRVLASMSPPAALTPGLWLLLWACSWSWLVLAFGSFHLLMTFPSGRLLTPRWRWAVALELALIGSQVALSAITDPMGPNVDNASIWTIHNPIGLIDTANMGMAFNLVWGAGLVTITVLSAVALVLRFRRGTRDERAQLKWPAAAAVLFGAIFALNLVASVVPGGPYPFEALLGFGLAAIPVSVAVAILRYRLYDIDRLVSRTVSWALLTGLLVAVFATSVVVLSTVLNPHLPGGTITVAASTLIAFGVFQPLRSRVQRVVDRRFNRTRFDHEATAAWLGERLRDQMDLADLQRDLGSVVVGTFHPRMAEIWIRTAAERPR